MQLTDFVQREQARAEIFNLFSALFAQPELELLRNPDLIDSLSFRLELLTEDAGNLAKQLGEAVLMYSETELLVEYARLFVGPFKTLAPPYSSVYLGDGTVMNDHTIWVLNQYRNAGIDFDFEVRDLPDHIAVENSFLYFITFKMLQGVQEADSVKTNRFFDIQKQFIEQHYALWVPKFCQTGLENTDNEFYRALFELQMKMAAVLSSQALPDGY